MPTTCHSVYLQLRILLSDNIIQHGKPMISLENVFHAPSLASSSVSRHRADPRLEVATWSESGCPLNKATPHARDISLVLSSNILGSKAGIAWKDRVWVLTWATFLHFPPALPYEWIMVRCCRPQLGIVTTWLATLVYAH